ncbi:MAG: hypothetical protein M3Y91_02750 [Actinomycetota bacterium]|nr:hypothetical protein [Actinomycetota bacterium]
MDDEAGPERYLRLLLEEALTRARPGPSPLAALRAIAGGGLLDAGTTGHLQRDLSQALALRDDVGVGALRPPSKPRRSAEDPSAATTPCVAAVGPATIDLPGASLHVDAIISDGAEARLEGRLVVAGPDGGASPARRLESVVVTDDAGTTYALTPTAEPGADGFTADLRPPVPAEASWLELSGGRERPVRLALYESPGDPIEAVPHGRSPVEHYLRGLVTARLALLLLDGTADSDGDAGPAIDALVATGAITAGAPGAVEAARIDEVALGFDDGAGMDPRILTVLDGRARVGRRGVWPLLSSPAVVDGVVVRIDTLAADVTHLRVLGVCPWPTPLDVPLSFTATDDVGGWYAGVGRAPGVGDALAWALVPALDPAAGELTLAVTGPRHSLSISLELT